MATDKPRYTISVSEEMLEDIIAFQDENHIATRSGAISRLIRLGLEELQEAQHVVSIEPVLSEEALRVAQAFDRAGEREKELVRLSLADQLSPLSEKGKAV